MYQYGMKYGCMENITRCLNHYCLKLSIGRFSESGGQRAITEYCEESIEMELFRRVCIEECSSRSMEECDEMGPSDLPAK